MMSDPSGDDFKYYRDDLYDSQEADILTRYKRFNRHEGNSPTIEMSSSMNAAGYPTQSSNQPDVEDINQDNNFLEYILYY